MRAIISVLVMAIVTYLIRVLPIAVFKKDIKSRFFRSFLYYIPYAVLSALTFPAILWSTGSFGASLAGTIAAVILAYMEQSMVVVAIVAIVVAYAFGIFL